MIFQIIFQLIHDLHQQSSFQSTQRTTTNILLSPLQLFRPSVRYYAIGKQIELKRRLSSLIIQVLLLMLAAQTHILLIPLSLKYTIILNLMLQTVILSSMEVIQYST